jgi:hypothetical protein
LHINNGGIAPAHVHVTVGDHVIEAQAQFDDHVRVETDPATSLTFTAGVAVASGKTLVKTGAGTVIAPRILGGALAVNAGSMVMAPGGGTSVFEALSIAGGATPIAKLDLANNAAIIDYPADGPSPETTIRAQIISGRGGSGLGKTWNGLGITSSTAAADPVNAGSVGYAVNGQLPLGPYDTFGGQPVDVSTVLMSHTRTGDANLDGVVNNDDVTIVGANYAPGFARPRWDLGDFDYNGFVDNDDVTLVGAFYDPAAPPLAGAVPSNADEITAVPEPSALLLLLIAAACWRLRPGRPA